ncbi:MAG: ribosome-associated protein [Gammaproteobacteria bacterium]|jgi:ribosome-associated protein
MKKSIKKNNTSEGLCKKLELSLDDLKANKIVTLDVKEIASFTDYMIIASGRSNTHVRALADKIIETAKKYNTHVIGTEGQDMGEWVLIDLGDIVVHVMQQSTRDHYQLEKLWSLDSPGDQSLSN